MTDDVTAIAQVKARHLRTMDTKDWPGMRRVFADDVVVDFTDIGGAVTSGADAVTDLVSSSLEGARSVHQAFLPEITTTSPGAATAIWAMQDVVVWPGGTRTIGFGHYHETYVQVDGQWLIKTTKLTRLHAETEEDRG